MALATYCKDADVYFTENPASTYSGSYLTLSWHSSSYITV